MGSEDRTVVKVLIAERHRTVAQALSALVTVEGTAQVSAQVHDAAAALTVGGEVEPDIALVDLSLSPNCSLVTRLHRECPRTRIVVLADQEHTDPQLIVHALASGAIGAIYKESSTDELHTAMYDSSTEAPVVPGDAVGLLLGSYMAGLSEKRQRDLATIEALASALEAKDLVTGQHVYRVA